MTFFIRFSKIHLKHACLWIYNCWIKKQFVTCGRTALQNQNASFFVLASSKRKRADPLIISAVVIVKVATCGLAVTTEMMLTNHFATYNADWLSRNLKKKLLRSSAMPQIYHKKKENGKHQGIERALKCQHQKGLQPLTLTEPFRPVSYEVHGLENTLYVYVSFIHSFIKYSFKVFRITELKQSYSLYFM